LPRQDLCFRASTHPIYLISRNTKAYGFTSWVAGLAFGGSASTQVSLQEVSDTFSNLVKEKFHDVEIFISITSMTGDLDERSDNESDEGFHEGVEGQNMAQYNLCGIVRTNIYVKEYTRESYWIGMV
jgi:hypothetical protein